LHIIAREVVYISTLFQCFSCDDFQSLDYSFKIEEDYKPVSNVAKWSILATLGMPLVEYQSELKCGKILLETIYLCTSPTFAVILYALFYVISGCPGNILKSGSHYIKDVLNAYPEAGHFHFRFFRGYTTSS